MLTRTLTGATRGIDAYVIGVEVHSGGNGLNRLRIVGLPDAAIRESEVRVRAALRTNAIDVPEGTVTVNLAPAGIRKQGAAFDLAIALGVAGVAGVAPVGVGVLERTLFLGELALDGSLRPVRGVLPIVSEAAKSGDVEQVVVPRENGREAALVRTARVFTAGSFREALDLLSDPGRAPVAPVASSPNGRRPRLDLADVKGQRQAKRALEIAAAGGHNLLFVGPPGGGKSLLAARLPSLLPPLRFGDALAVTKIYSVAGLLDEGELVSHPPFRAPHHTISSAAMVGGGNGPMPGEVSLAHRGVLFLDELAEFPRDALESLRQPLEEGRVRIRRVDRVAALPARFTLVAAMNPCPCGFRGVEGRVCECTPSMIQRYRGKISGPLLDRIDLRVAVRALRPSEMFSPAAGSSSDDVRPRVAAARRLQAKRLRTGRLNAFMTPRQITRHCALDARAEIVLREALDRLGLSARGFHRTLKVARTIADLAGADGIEAAHVSEAIHFRATDLPESGR